MLRNVVAVSDDECPVGATSAAAAIVAPPERAVVKVEKRKNVPGQRDVVIESEIRQKLSKLLASSCYCSKKRKTARASSCFVAFQTGQTFRDLLALRFDLRTMSKEDSDKKAI